MGTEYQTNEFPLDKVQIVCDDCLTVCEVRRAGNNYGCVFAVTCKCGRREMVGTSYKFTVLSAQGRILLSHVLETSRRTPGAYERNEPNKNRMFIELDTGQIIESDEDVNLFVWGIEQGSKSYDTLEDLSVRLMKLYDRFKDIEQPGHEAPAPAKKKSKKN